MDYLITINIEETEPGPGPGEPGFEERMAAFFAYNQRLIDGGHWIAGASLQPSATATTVRLSDGSPSITDGPFAETKEQLGGFYLIAADDLDQAIELAGGIPIPNASLEVRPIAFRPDADHPVPG